MAYKSTATVTVFNAGKQISLQVTDIHYCSNKHAISQSRCITVLHVCKLLYKEIMMRAHVALLMTKLDTSLGFGR